MATKRGLGRGLDSLLTSMAVPDGDSPEIFMCPIERIRPNPQQPRMVMDEEALDALANSIEANGVIQPLVVREVEEGFEIICGERRWRAAQRAGLSNIPVVIKDVSPGEVLELALVENIQREDLNPVEEAMAYKRLVEELGMSHSEVAKRVGKQRSTVANALRLLRLPEPILRDLASGRISPGHARAILMLSSQEEMLKLHREICAKGLNVRQAEQRAKAMKRGRTQRESVQPDPDVAAVEEELTMLCGMKVRIKPMKRGGKIEFRYSRMEDLDQLLSLIRSSAGKEAGHHDRVDGL